MPLDSRVSVALWILLWGRTHSQVWEGVYFTYISEHQPRHLKIFFYSHKIYFVDQFMVPWQWEVLPNILRFRLRLTDMPSLPNNKYYRMEDFPLHEVQIFFFSWMKSSLKRPECKRKYNKNGNSTSAMGSSAKQSSSNIGIAIHSTWSSVEKFDFKRGSDLLIFFFLSEGILERTRM